MIDDFLWRALAAGLGVALVAGPLGCFIVWRRMAYFGDSLAHSALLGVALGLALHFDLTLGVLVSSAALALLLALLQRQRRLASDTLLGILAHSGLALSLVVLLDLMSYLFGDVLAVSGSDLLWIYGGDLVALAVLALLWRPLLAATIHEELARAEGVPVATVRIVFVLLVAIVIATASHEGGGDPADHRAPDHPGRRRPPVRPHPGADGALGGAGRGALGGVRPGRIAPVGHAGRPLRGGRRRRALRPQPAGRRPPRRATPQALTGPQSLGLRVKSCRCAWSGLSVSW
jgi:hypothetical protein